MQTKWKREKSKLQLYREQFINSLVKERFSKDEIEWVDLVQAFFPFFNRRNERRESMAELQLELNRQKRNSHDWPQRNA